VKLFTVNNIRTTAKHEVVAEDARHAKHLICAHFPKTVMSELKVWRSIDMENKTPRLMGER